ncbi:Uncharacterized protein FWK35_00025640 [Aphis craccivora]|uniref:Uncharacterized protein n=1 Tax=Aphis craccivora TaxID=307492 RepID=A0A6G0W091_APHCR|nr:Uncharacterized protein FWK35_00025640 [Aphis craccivora]
MKIYLNQIKKPIYSTNFVLKQDQLEKNDNNVSKLNNKTNSIDEICTETSTNEKRSETLSLIEAYENNISIFESNSKKNRTGWIQVSKDLKNKLNILRINVKENLNIYYCVTKKKLDNRHETGSANYGFDYFDELDRLFGRKPNIKPKYLASSSRVYNGLNEKGIFNEDNVSASTLHTSNTPPEAKKQKKIPVHETGSANYEFDYFDEHDGLFGRKPNIKPKYLASSSRVYNGLNEKGIFNEDNVSASTLHTLNTPPEAKKQKKNPSVHEAAIQKRHDEKMAMSQLALDTYKNYMDKLLEKL